MRDARRAGSRPASPPTVMSTSAATTSVAGSRGSRPKSSVLTNRDAHTLTALPRTTPTPTSSDTRASTSRTTPGRRVGKRSVEQLRLLPDLVRDRVRPRGRPVFRLDVRHHHELPRRLHRQRAEQEAVDQRKDRRVRANPQRQREDRDDGDDGRRAQRAKSQADVMHRRSCVANYLRSGS